MSSRLIALRPCDRAGGFTESLTSYLARLADAHGLATWGLVAREFAPCFRRPLIDKQGHSDLFGPFGSALNGVAGTALQAVEILGRLTGQEKLDALTLLPFRDILSPKSSVRATVAWCPDCLSEWLQQSRTIYWPLVWQLDVVSICPIHTDRFLARVCPRCHTDHFQLCRKSSPGHCPNCGAWLGIENIATPHKARRVKVLDKFIAKECNELVQSPDTAFYKISAPVFRRNLRLILKHSFEGSVTAFSRAAQMHHNSVADVICGVARPGLDSILRLAHAARVETVKMIGQPISMDDILKRSIHPVVCSFQRRTCRRYDWGQVAKVLRRELAERDSFPSSLFALCRPLGLDSGYVALRLNASAETLVVRYRNAVSKRRQHRENAESEDLKAMILHCLAKGVWPSNRRLRTLVKSPGSLRNPEIERERHRAVAEVLKILERNDRRHESLAGLCSKKGRF